MNAILDALQSSFMQSYRAPEGEYRIDCPYCGDSKGHCYVNYNKKTWNCFRCSEGGSVWKLFKDLGIKIDYDVEEEVAPLVPTPVENAEAGLPVEYIPLPCDGYEGDLAIRYLLNRKVTLTQIEKYKIGFCSRGRYAGRVIIPVEDGASFVARLYTGGAGKKVLMPDKAKKGAMFNFDETAEHCVLCEGVFDAFRIGDDAVAIFGLTLSSAQFTRLKNSNLKRIAVMLDAEANVENSTLKMVKMLTQYFEVQWCRLPSGDPGETPYVILRKMINNTPILDATGVLLLSLATP